MKSSIIEKQNPYSLCKVDTKLNNTYWTEYGVIKGSLDLEFLIEHIEVGWRRGTKNTRMQI